MESPITTVKAAIMPGALIKYFLAGIFFWARLDLAGVTNWFLYPVTTARAKFGKPTGS